MTCFIFIYLSVEVEDCALQKNANQIIQIYCTSRFSRLVLAQSVQEAVSEFLILLHYLFVEHYINPTAIGCSGSSMKDPCNIFLLCFPFTLLDPLY